MPEDQDKYINQRFDAVDQRFAQDKYINQRFDAVDQRFDDPDASNAWKMTSRNSTNLLSASANASLAMKDRSTSSGNNSRPLTRPRPEPSVSSPGAYRS